MKDLIYHIVPEALHPQIEGVSDDELRAICDEYEFDLQPDHAEFLSLAGASDPDVFSDVYDFRLGERSSSPFVPRFQLFVCVGYNPYPDSDSLYTDIGGSPSAGVFALRDEQLHAMSHAQLVARPPAYTCFGSAFADALYQRYFVRSGVKRFGFCRPERKDVHEAVELAERLGMRKLLHTPDAAMFIRDGIVMFAGMHIAARMLGCGFAGGDPLECQRLFHIVQENMT